MIKLKDKYVLKSMNMNEHGGLRMVGINSYITGLKSTWIRRLIRDNNLKIENIVGEYYQHRKAISWIILLTKKSD